jgi:hypothetical protein
MIKYLFTFILALGISATACKSKTKNTQTTSEPACKVVFMFGSRGDGINEKKLNELTALLNSKKLKYTQKVAGREGEKEICIPLGELKGKEKTDFVEQLKTFEDKSTFVSLSVN